MKSTMVLSILVLYLLITIAVVNSSTLFIKPIRTVGKQNLYLKLHGVVKDKKHVNTEDKLSAIVKEEPILTIQTISNGFVYIAGISQFFSLIPDSFENKLRLQCLMMLSTTTLLDVIRDLEISPYEIRDDYFMNDLLDQAITEIKSLATDATSLTLSYYLTCMAIHQSTKYCLIPFLIRELPNFIQLSVIIWLLSQSNIEGNDKSPIPSALSWLFIPTTTTTDTSSNNNNKTINSESKNIANINQISNRVADLAEIYITMNSLFNLLFSTKTQNIRSIVDMIILTIQILLVQNFITKRIKLISEDKNIIYKYILNSNIVRGVYHKFLTFSKGYWKQLFNKKHKKIYKIHHTTSTHKDSRSSSGSSNNSSGSSNNSSGSNNNSSGRSNELKQNKLKRKKEKKKTTN